MADHDTHDHTGIPGVATGTITSKDEGSTLSSTVTTLDFTGAGVTASGSGATTTVNIPGGAGGATIQYPGLKPSTPTDDFAGSSLGGGWSAHSNSGTFTTSHVKTQGEDWGGSAVELQFSNQSGTIYQTHANTDLDFTVGGIRVKNFVHGGVSSLQYTVGIAALDSSGNGHCVMIFNDGNAYFAPVVTYAQSGTTDSWTNFGISQYSTEEGDWWMRLKRVSTTWTGYISISGRTWDKTFTTSTTAYTVAQLHFGMLRTGASYGRVTADYFQVDV